MKIYVASSWRNERQSLVVGALRAAGHEVYDFRHPKPGNDGFHWSDIDPDWQQWTPDKFAEALDHPIARAGYHTDREAMEWAEAFVLVMPCGRSAHLEAGWAVGAGKPTVILLSDGEPELMYSLANAVCTTLEDLVGYFRVIGNTITLDEFAERLNAKAASSEPALRPYPAGSRYGLVRRENLLAPETRDESEKT